jgi:hypothetical protein
MAMSRESKLFELSSRRDFQERRYIHSFIYVRVGTDG